MDWKDVIPVLAGGLVILVVALVVKPALLGEPIGSVSPGPVPTPAPPAYVPPTPAPTATPFPEEGEVYTRTFRWTAIDGGVHTTQVRVPEALFLEHRATPRFADALAWGRYALADADRPFLADLAGRIAPPTANPEEEYYRLMNLVFFVQQIPYAPDNSTASYTEGVLPRHARHVKGGVEYPRYPVETLVDGKGDCEDAAILMAGLLDVLDYDAVLLRYPDHMAIGIRMEGFNPYYAKYTPRYFVHEGKHYYYLEGTGFVAENVTPGSPALRGKPFPIGDTQDGPLQSVRSRTPEIIPLRYIIEPAGYHIRPVRLPAGGV
ncbi:MULTISPECIES: hypothetical protein [unclassified Methanoculleus]|uniref:hypothetical protein n=1 Tax=unclassified Methanoculleus TaxID=2619537 RepID=UPI0025E34691|nr:MULTISPECIES: hypothetical protein [unclassified Methanoculleus]MDD2252951.1 hypothetical protein [Methanoculleus sp.]MDD2787970.1 hypothetical protein [Methanoculleus sp.]MDD3215926.1 hypothetical protein [Methanoculleus sp.]MDD4313676.1 hypothetical protein [Methanoculleus sp.]MDD4470147.1 hypothetical protein [Methanoculleus sp.]